MKFRDRALEAAERIFAGGDDVKTHEHSGVRSVDADLTSGPVTGKVRFIEQNPKKETLYGELAQQGHKIVWICTVNDEGHMSYTGWGVVNGEYTTTIHDTCLELAVDV